jgi:hypothetical protein
MSAKHLVKKRFADIAESLQRLEKTMLGDIDNVIQQKGKKMKVID